MTSSSTSFSLEAAAAAPPHSRPLKHIHHHHHHNLIIILSITLALGFFISILILLICLIYRKVSHNRTAPSDKNDGNPSRFSYSLLCRYTASFSPSTQLGHGGFGSVYRATLPSGLSLAVKVMDSTGSLQAEREFHNELSISSSLHHPNILSLLGHSADNRRRRLLLVYELMPNRSLQDALFDKKCTELMDWGKRFNIALNIALGLQYLHHLCSPPVIHGDIKPSNILLDSGFKAKIGDFGLAKLKTEDGVVEEEEQSKMKEDIVEDNVNESISLSPESCVIRAMESEELPEEGEKSSIMSSVDDSGKDLIGEKRGDGSRSRRDWWWKQDNGGGGGGGENGPESKVKDYVMEWIKSEIKKERPKSEWIASSLNEDLAKNKKKNKNKENTRKPREWWREEFCEELAKKKKKREQQEEDKTNEQQARKRSRKSKNSTKATTIDIPPKTGGNGVASSTPSMRGTICYISPEYGCGKQLSEKCDVYSFGVLLLVLVSGRRPLQVMVSSPRSEFERANLISWARQLARNGKLLDIVDPSVDVHSLNREEALMCVTIALSCLQRLPSNRPSMNEIVAMLLGQAEPLHLPFEFSPSPPSSFI